MTLGKSDGLVDVGSASCDGVASDGGGCDGVGSGGTGDMVWKYGVADDVDDIVRMLSDIFLLLVIPTLGKSMSLRIDVGMLQPRDSGLRQHFM